MASRRQFPAHQLLDRTGVGNIVGKRCEVIQPVRVGNELVVMHVLGDLLIPSMQEAHVGVGLRDDFAVEFKD